MSWLQIAFYSVLAFFILISVVMILLVLIQRGRGGGLVSAFSGAGSQTAFGAKTGDVLTWTTAVVFGLFVVCAISLNLMANSMSAARKPVLAPVNAAPLPTVTTPAESPAALPPTTLP
jgi:preprotein translocase subunit SecG